MYKINGLPVYRWEIKDTEDGDGVSVMSIVDDPAVERSFMAYSKSKPKKTKLIYSLDHDKQVITGVAIRAGFPIYRNEGGEEFFTVFESDVIERIVYKFMKERRNTEVNINHSDYTDKAFLFESYLLRAGHREMFPEFTDVEIGSWIVSYRIEDKELWDKIKAKDLNGFSIEMYGALVPYKRQTKTAELIEMFNALNAIQ